MGHSHRGVSRSKREILINVRPYEKRIAILEDGRLSEVFYERPDSTRLVGDVYKGVVNAVLPGPLDTPMTHANLTAAQIASLRGATPLGSLPSLEDVCGLVGFLCSPDNSGVTGQFVAADRGFSHVRII